MFHPQADGHADELKQNFDLGIPPMQSHNANAAKLPPVIMMPFAQRLADVAALMDTRLEECLSRMTAAAPRRLADAMRYGVLNGGKRFRPLLMIESAALFGLGVDRVLNAAVAIELVHCYSLIHDDLPAMDNDDLRRGQPTMHKAFDEWTAILAGDALQALSFEIVAQPATHVSAQVRIDLVAAFAKAAGGLGMAGGQCLDLEADKLSRATDLPGVYKLHAMKTGALMAFACEAGAILAEAGSDDQLRLATFGAELGLAFQMVDDLLDATSEAAILGKAAGKDAEHGKATIVSLVGIEAARDLARDTERRALDVLAPYGASANGLREATRFCMSRVS